jgi:predicted O-methyltransferase YrrM
MYKNVKVYSSYRKNDLGKSLYNTVLKYKPKKIIDFGVLEGYSTIAMAQAVKDLEKGSVVGYDLFEDYPYRHSTLKKTQKNIKKHGVDDVVTLKRQDFYEWIEEPEEFNLLHLDISNDGEIVELAHRKLKRSIDSGAVFLFEGGTKERDQVEWMVKYNKPPMRPLKSKLKYKVLDKRFPGISIITK